MNFKTEDDELYESKREARRLYPACARLDGVYQTVRGALHALRHDDKYTCQVQLQSAEAQLLALMEKTGREGA